MSSEETGASERVTNIDEIPANRNWLRIVGAMHAYQRGEMTADEYRQRVAFLSEQPAESIRLPDNPATEADPSQPEK